MPQSRDMASLKRRYLLDIDLYERTYQKWESRGKKIVDRYRDERNEAQQGTDNRYNILWSNVQTILPAVFARLPKPEVSRRYKDKDPVGRVASLLLERALEFEIEQYPDYASAVGNSVEDRLLPGRGIAWVRYEPITKSAQLTDDVTKDIIDYECTPVDYVAWQDFGHNVARTWEEVYLVWRKVPLDRSELVKRFGKDIGNQVPLDQKPDLDREALATPESESLKKATVYEIWDKKEGLVVWLSKGFEEALDAQDDPLHLDSFFPCPKPLYATTTTNTLVPVPDYAQYQDQAKELDTICDRINGLVNALRAVGVYDASQKALANLLTTQDNTMVPVDNWAMFAEKGGLKGVMDFLPLEVVVKTLDSLYVAREQAKAVIYEITGISDIIRGASDPNETLGAQELKGQFASKRLKKLQDSVAKFSTEILKIKAEIICKHYQDESILSISGADQLSPVDQQFIQPAVALLRDDMASNFRIEVSSDSLIEVDEQQEKQSRIEFITAVSGFLEKAIMLPPQLHALAGEVLLYGVRAYKAGKTLEGTIEQTVEQLKEQASQPQQQKPDPETMKIQAQSQIEQAKLQGHMQLEQVKDQSETMRNDKQLQAQMQLEQMKLQMQQETELQKAQIQAQTQLQIAQINAQCQAAQAERDDARERDRIAQEGVLKQQETAVNAESAEADNSVSEQLGKIMEAVSGLAEQVKELAEEAAAPIEYGRGSDGKVVSIKKGKRTMNVSYGPDGRMAGVK